MKPYHLTHFNSLLSLSLCTSTAHVKYSISTFLINSDSDSDSSVLSIDRSMDSSLIRVRRPLLLKDHLLDDLSSCSSNGFRSFPRRSPQCCPAVRFQIPPSKSSPLSALRSAVAAAAKRLSFAAAKSTEKKRISRKKSSSLARSLSRKLLERGGFWKRKREWKPLDQLMKEDSDPDSSVDSKSSNSCWGSDFTVSYDDSSSAEGKMVSGVQKDGAENGVVSSGSTQQKQWSSDQEKEQFSPVSVLDCPFDDEDDEDPSVFKNRLARMEGTKLQLMKKIQRFECLSKLEPVNLATQFALQTENSDNESSDYTLPHLDEKSISDIEEEEEADEEAEAEHRALELLHQVRANCSPSYQDLNLKEDELLLDFFRERIRNYKLASSVKQRGLSSFDKVLLSEAEDWINGRKPRQVFAEWEVQKNRQAYVDDMEKRGEWRTLDQEGESVALELENEVFAELMNELLLEISN